MAKFKVNIPAGPIWSNEDAKTKCPVVCAAHGGEWTGEWVTVVSCEMSVCECMFDTNKKGTTPLILNVPAGPLWSEEDAKEKCPVICASYGGEWTGRWVTPPETWGKFSVCECKFMV